MKGSFNMKLKAIIKELELIIKNLNEGELKTSRVLTVFGYEPVRFISWRGDYSEPALLFKRNNKYPNRPLMNIEEFYKQCKNVDGQEFIGYKGGEFVMNDEQEVRVVSEDGQIGMCKVRNVILSRLNDLFIELEFRDHCGL
jgi:hypothetical protein